MVAAHVTSTGAWFRLPFSAAPAKVASRAPPSRLAVRRTCLCSFPYTTSSGGEAGASAARAFCTVGAERCQWGLTQRGALQKLVLLSDWQQQPRTLYSRSFGGSASSAAGVLRGPLLVLLQHKQSRAIPHAQPDEGYGLPMLPLEAYDSYCRQIRHAVEQAVGPQRQAEFRRVNEGKKQPFLYTFLLGLVGSRNTSTNTSSLFVFFRSLRLVTRSMSGLHATFLLLLLAAPPTSLELLLAPHAQFCCLCIAQAASATFWGFGVARPGPLTGGGLAVGDWR